MKGKNAETCVIWPRDGDEATPPLDNSKCPKMSLASSSWSWPSPTLFSAGDGGGGKIPYHLFDMLLQLLGSFHALHQKEGK